VTAALALAALNVAADVLQREMWAAQRPHIRSWELGVASGDVTRKVHALTGRPACGRGAGSLGDKSRGFATSPHRMRIAIKKVDGGKSRLDKG
jgi:hypothetical protein